MIDLEKLRKMLDDMQQLLVNKSIAQSRAHEIDQAGIRLERDVYTETLKYLKDINDHLPEVEELKEGLNKVGCVFQVIVVSILLHAEFGRNDHRGDALKFRFN